MLILARTAGIRVDMDDIILNPFVPMEYISCGKNELLTCLKGIDAEFKSLFRNAKKAGCTLRYVAELKVDKSVPAISVGMQQISLEHELAQFKGSANKVMISAGPYGINGNGHYSLEAPGAGVCVTARNARRDLLHQLR